MQYKNVIFCLFLLFTFLFKVEAIEFKNLEHSNYGDLKDKDHIREHLKSLTQNSDELPPDLSEEDMIYYLFLIHDMNNDGFLDGHELVSAFTDFGDEHEDPSKYLSLKDVTEMVDHVLEEDDLNGDGLISWSEYLESQTYHRTK